MALNPHLETGFLEDNSLEWLSVGKDWGHHLQEEVLGLQVGGDHPEVIAASVLGLHAGYVLGYIIVFQGQS